MNLKEAAAATPDPPRAERNLERLNLDRFMESAGSAGAIATSLPLIANLFAHSQFLANYSANNPQALLLALEVMKEPHTVEFLGARASE
ncbi:hypothetical protein LCGC14_2084240, partial [marine sediment metagenome]